LVIIGQSKNRITSKIVGKKDIASVQDLKGKRLGIDRIGSNPDMFAQAALSRFKIDTFKDLQYVQLGDVGKVVAALKAGAIDAGIAGAPHDLFAQRLDFKVILDIDLLKIPNATYCHPEIGSVGLSEAKAEEAGYNVKVGKFPFTANSRASIVGQHEGFIKIVSDADYGEILGVHIIGPQATELIAEAVAAIELEATVEDLMWTIHAHPTLAEAMLDAANSVYGMPINA